MNLKLLIFPTVFRVTGKTLRASFREELGVQKSSAARGNPLAGGSVRAGSRRTKIGCKGMKVEERRVKILELASFRVVPNKDPYLPDRSA